MKSRPKMELGMDAKNITNFDCPKTKASSLTPDWYTGDVSSVGLDL